METRWANYSVDTNTELPETTKPADKIDGLIKSSFVFWGASFYALA